MNIRIVDPSLEAFYAILENKGQDVATITFGEAGVISLEILQPINPNKLRTFIYDVSKKYKAMKGALLWQENERLTIGMPIRFLI